MINASVTVVLQSLLIANISMLPPANEAPSQNYSADTVRVAAVADSLPTKVGWKLLGTLDSQRGIVPAALQALQGKRVRIPGFVVPLEDLNSDVKEFLLVPYYGACVHMPPPPPNQMVFVQLATKVKVTLFDAIWIEGMLEIIKVESPYGVVGYRLQGTKLTPYENTP